MFSGGKQLFGNLFWQIPHFPLTTNEGPRGEGDFFFFSPVVVAAAAIAAASGLGVGRAEIKCLFSPRFLFPTFPLSSFFFALIANGVRNGSRGNKNPRGRREKKKLKREGAEKRKKIAPEFLSRSFSLSFFPFSSYVRICNFIDPPVSTWRGVATPPPHSPFNCALLSFPPSPVRAICYQEN